MEFSLPKAFEYRMVNQLGGEYGAFIEGLKLPAPICIRYNTAKHTLPQNNDLVKWEPNGVYLNERPIFTLDPLFHAGAYYVQEASSMFTGWIIKNLISDNNPVKILDLCAAPGGKSTQIASIIGKNSLLVSNEVIGNRAAILSENIIKWGNPNVLVTRNDPKDFKSLDSFFDIVVVDAPCSGEGLFRKDISAINEWSEDNARHCAQRQQRIIADIWTSIKPGGYLVYSTCTFNPDENEKNIEWITHNFDAECLAFDVPREWGISSVETGMVKAYQFWPHRIKGEGFFLSVIKKNEENNLKTSKYKERKHYQPVSKTLLTELKKYTQDGSEFSYYMQKDTVIAIPQVIDTDYRRINDHIYISDAGITLAKVYGNKLAPEHALSMSWALNMNHFSLIEVERSSALKYLHKDNLFIADAKPGYNLVTHQNIPLGWIKNIGNRWNNLYPQNWRIRMQIQA